MNAWKGSVTIFLALSLSSVNFAGPISAFYESVLTPGTRLIAGDPKKNEFFIVDGNTMPHSPSTFNHAPRIAANANFNHAPRIVANKRFSPLVNLAQNKIASQHFKLSLSSALHKGFIHKVTRQSAYALNHSSHKKSADKFALNAGLKSHLVPHKKLASSHHKKYFTLHKNSRVAIKKKKTSAVIMAENHIHYYQVHYKNGKTWLSRM